MVGAGTIILTMQQLPLGVRLPDRAVFASFLAARNGQAVEHARQVANAEVAGTTWLPGWIICGTRIERY